jgi:hypothetical protein
MTAIARPFDHVDPGIPSHCRTKSPGSKTQALSASDRRSNQKTNLLSRLDLHGYSPFGPMQSRDPTEWFPLELFDR